MGAGIFLAGAAGAIGRRLTALLSSAGHAVWATTRDASKFGLLRDLGAEPVLIDVFDAEGLAQAVVAVRPEIIIHQLTDLPKNLDPSKMGDAMIRNARIRDIGTKNLVEAALGAGARRFIAQSIAWAYAPGPTPYTEAASLDDNAEGNRAITVGGVMALERHVLHAAPLQGTILRYGQLYGPGTGSEAPTGTSPVHVDAAAHAAFLAVTRGATGIYNIAESNVMISSDKAIGDLGWDAGYRSAT